MIEKYFGWIDGWSDLNMYFIQADMSYYTWMYDGNAILLFALLGGTLSLIYFIASMILMMEGDAEGSKKSFIMVLVGCAIYFILPPLLSVICYLWEPLLVAVIVAGIKLLLGISSKPTSKSDNYKAHLRRCVA